jgi:hypothetical protein
MRGSGKPFGVVVDELGKEEIVIRPGPARRRGQTFSSATIG